MPAWKEHHYDRAREFLNLIADAVVASSSQAPANPTELATTTASEQPVATPAATPPSGPSAASVFKKVPWKK